MRKRLKAGVLVAREGEKGGKRFRAEVEWAEISGTRKMTKRECGGGGASHQIIKAFGSEYSNGK